MISRRTATGLVASSVLSTALPAPGRAEGGRAGSAASGVVLARLKLAGGGMAEFREPMPGELVVSALTPLMGRDARVGGADLDVRRLASLSALGKYQALSGGREPPRGLIAAQQRVAAARRQPSRLQPQAGPSFLPPVDKTARRLMEQRQSDAKAPVQPQDYPVGSGDWFRESYCIWREKFCFCLLYRTGDGSVVRTNDNIDSTAYCYRGGVRHTLEYESCFLWICNWNLSVTQFVPQGWVGHIWASGPVRARRASLTEAAGDGFHWSVYGGDLGRSCADDPIACACWVDSF